MLSILINLVFIVTILLRYYRNKSTFWIFLLLTILSPRIPVGSAEIDGIYLTVICIAIAIIIKKNAHICSPRSYIKSYIVLIFCVYLLYLISWALFNRKDSSSVITTMSGAIKHIVLIYEIFECNKNVKELDIQKEVMLFITIAVSVNIVALLYEIIDYSGAVSLLSNVFFNVSETDFLMANVHGGALSRYYGLFSYPMGLGMFACYSIAYLISASNININRRIILIALSVILGVYSASKSFFVGTAIILIAYLVLNLFTKNVSKKSIRIVVCLLILITCIFMLYDHIYNFIYENLGLGFARYFGFLKNIQGILYSRFDSENGVLISTIEVIKKYWLLGVGPTSVANEPVMDNAYIVLLHNGGIIALGTIVIFYFKLFVKSKHRKDLLLMLVAILATGMGFQTVLASDISLWLIIVVLWETSYGEKRLSNNQSHLCRTCSVI